MVDTEKYIRKPLYVDAVRVTNANFDEIATWCQGEVLDENGKRYIKVRVHNPKVPRQTKAFVGDWLLYTERGYKVYTNKAFHASFDLVEGVEPKVETELPTRLGNVSYTSEEKDQLAVQQLDEPLTEEEEAVVATDDGLAVADSSTAPPVPEGKTVISEEEQAAMEPEEIRELIQSGDYILAQDLVA